MSVRQRIARQKYSVRSGVCAVRNSKIRVGIDKYGQYFYKNINFLSKREKNELDMIDLMSVESPDESKIADDLYKQNKNIKYDNIVGYYQDLYAGYVAEGNYRRDGTSGGFATWILVKLFEEKLIDGVIHVKKNGDKKSSILFTYQISKTKKEIINGAKSRYYPCELSEVLKLVKEHPGKYAITGIPEFITEVRLLSIRDVTIAESIVFYVGLICGHQKSMKYAESLAWQCGIKPGNLLDIDFRVKRKGKTAGEYLTRMSGMVEGREVTFLKEQSELFAAKWAWNTGLFKTNFSDYTDNAFNENADIVLGDAWVEEYTKDPNGNNIVIVRNSKISKIIRDAIKNKLVVVDKIDVETVKKSQQGLIHHTRDELPYRLYREGRYGRWVPKKRVKPGDDLLVTRREIQDIRTRIASKSHQIYRRAVIMDDFNYFESKMQKLIKRYNQYYGEVNAKGGCLSKYYGNSRIIFSKICFRLKNLKQKLRIRTRARGMVMKWRAKRADGIILTLSGYFNYGGIMQRYALQTFLAKHDFHYYVDRKKIYDNQLDTDQVVRYTRLFAKERLHEIDMDAKNSRDFFSNYIVGSDQVWRNWGFDPIEYYFLKFVKNKNARKIAFAASFGVDSLADANIDEKKAKELRGLAKEFDAISMREESGVKILRKDWDIKAKSVLDPTMLLTKDDYSKLVDDCGMQLGEIGPLFSYILDFDERIEDFIKNTAENMEYKYHLKKEEQMGPVEQWLKGFRDAELVITDSFHGVVFSIINNVDFIVIGNEGRGLARITSLLEMFGIEDRLVNKGYLESFNIRRMKKIKWDKVSIRLAELREESGNWLLTEMRRSK